MGLGGTLVVPIIPQSIEYAESNSDLGDGEERILIYDSRMIKLIPSDDDDMGDDESTLK